MQELLEAGLSGRIDYALLSRVASAASRSAPDMLDDLASLVARQYAEDGMSYEATDAIMNSAFALACSEKFWAEHDRTIPEVTYEVYLAFDAGEYYHPGDGSDIDPEDQYTRPLIARFLATRGAGA